MSGGTWDYRQHQLRDLAQDIREGRARWSGYEDEDELDLPQARQAVARVLDTLGDLIHSLDYHFAGDSDISSERAWLLGAGARLRADVDTHFRGTS